jgi:hypothetical protein
LSPTARPFTAKTPISLSFSMPLTKHQKSKIQNPKSKIQNLHPPATRHPLPNVRQALEKLAQAKVGSPLQGDRP